MRKYYKYLILALGICAFVIGMLRGEPTAIFQKAATICMECIGIG